MSIYNHKSLSNLAIILCLSSFVFVRTSGWLVVQDKYELAANRCLADAITFMNGRDAQDNHTTICNCEGLLMCECLDDWCKNHPDVSEKCKEKCNYDELNCPEAENIDLAFCKSLPRKWSVLKIFIILFGLILASALFCFCCCLCCNVCCCVGRKDNQNGYLFGFSSASSASSADSSASSAVSGSSAAPSGSSSISAASTSVASSSTAEPKTTFEPKKEEAVVPSPNPVCDSSCAPSDSDCSNVPNVLAPKKTDESAKKLAQKPVKDFKLPNLYQRKPTQAKFVNTVKPNLSEIRHAILD